MTTVNQKLDLILEKLASIETRLARIELSCGGMDSHIGFVEGVYGTLRSPLDFISSQISRLSGSDHESLPDTIQVQRLTE